MIVDYKGYTFRVRICFISNFDKIHRLTKTNECCVLVGLSEYSIFGTTRHECQVIVPGHAEITP